MLYTCTSLLCTRIQRNFILKKLPKLYSVSTIPSYNMQIYANLLSNCQKDDLIVQRNKSPNLNTDMYVERIDHIYTYLTNKQIFLCLFIFLSNFAILVVTVLAVSDYCRWQIMHFVLFFQNLQFPFVIMINHGIYILLKSKSGET